jgi:hypothetical protein
LNDFPEVLASRSNVLSLIFYLAVRSSSASIPRSNFTAGAIVGLAGGCATMALNGFIGSQPILFVFEKYLIAALRFALLASMETIALVYATASPMRRNQTRQATAAVSFWGRKGCEHAIAKAPDHPLAA